MPILATQNLTKEFQGIKALDNLSLKFNKGKITGLIGPNGSGKTTLINIFFGLLPMDNGTVEINSKKFSSIRPCDTRALGLARTFQNVRLCNQLSVLDNLLLVFNDKNIFSSLYHKQNNLINKAEEILNSIGLLGKKDKFAGDLSYGQRKLLEIGRVLAADTAIMMFDEPFAGLFPGMIKTVRNIIINLRAREKTIILVEHNMNLIRQLCDHVIVLDQGHLFAQGQLQNVLSQKNVLDIYLGK
jgi:ABC-type branched-subunit amino acid transport system ATPase component